MLTHKQQFFKRTFDVMVSLIALLIVFFPLILLSLISWVNIGLSGIFSQWRVGKGGKQFKIYKIRTLKGKQHRLDEMASHTTPWGSWLRKSKLDELPQLYNILKGDMSLVGPRPDLPGFADQLTGEDRIILKVRPGLTGPATIKYKNEDQLLKEQSHPEKYNQEVIWPDKVKINKKYIENWSFLGDLKYIYKSIKH